jgi:capsid protein
MSVRSSQKLMADLMIAAVWNRFVEECVIIGVTSLTAQEYLKYPWRWKSHKVMPPSWIYAVNPGEEVKANTSSMNTNQSTLEDVLGEKGMYWKETLRQRAKERAMERQLDVVPPETALAEHQAELSSGAAATDPEDSSRGTPKESAVAT